MQNFLNLWLNAGAQITHGGQVQKPRQKNTISPENNNSSGPNLNQNYDRVPAPIANQW